MKTTNVLNEIKCIVCNSTNVLLNYRLPYGDVFLCKECQVAFTNFKDKNEFYIANSKWDEFDRLKSQIYILPELRKIALNRLRLLQKYSKGKNLIEFGPNTGEFLHVASKHGFQVTGVDQFPAILNLNKCKGMNFISSKAEEINIKEKFDIVAAFHLFEHLEKPKHFLDVVWSMLNENGILFLEVPNYNSHSRIAQREKWDMFYNYHLTHFDDISLSGLLVKCGFKLLKVRTVQPLNLLFDKYYLPIRHFAWTLLKKIFSTNKVKLNNLEVRNKEVVCLSIEDENKIHKGLKSKMSGLEICVKNILSIPFIPYAYFVSKNGRGDMLQIIATKDG